MFEKVNPAHPDKIADRIAGAVTDLAYSRNENPHIATEVLIGHGTAYLIIETDILLINKDIYEIVERISGVKRSNIFINIVKQDKHLNDNQSDKIKCGDNGIFKPTIITKEQQKLTNLAYELYKVYPYDGKYLIDGNRITVCQSNMGGECEFPSGGAYEYIINPLGYWTGGIDVDSGANNRKLGSDMGDGISGGGLHGKDLSKADVTMNICAMLDKKEYSCSIGDEYIDGKPYGEYVQRARDYIKARGGFERFAEWGLITPTKIS